MRDTLSVSLCVICVQLLSAPSVSLWFHYIPAPAVWQWHGDSGVLLGYHTAVQHGATEENRTVISHSSCLKHCPSNPGGLMCHNPLSCFKASPCIPQHRGKEEKTGRSEGQNVVKWKLPYRRFARPPAPGQDLINLLEIRGLPVALWEGGGWTLCVSVCVGAGGCVSRTCWHTKLLWDAHTEPELWL